MQDKFICNVSAVVQGQVFSVASVAETLDKAEEEARHKLGEIFKKNTSNKAQSSSLSVTESSRTNCKTEKQMRPVTESQLRMIYGIAKGLHIDPAPLTRERYGKEPEGLVNWEANLVIRDLQSKQHASVF